MNYRTVLILEDEPSLLKMMVLVLEAHGFRTRGAGTVEEALEIAREQDTDLGLLISDVFLHGISGRGAAERIRDIQPSLECLFMSGYGRANLVERGVLLPEDAFLQKPFRPQELLAHVRAVVRDPFCSASSGRR